MNERLTPYEEGVRADAKSNNPYPQGSNKAKWWQDGRNYTKRVSESPENYVSKDEPSVAPVAAAPVSKSPAAPQNSPRSFGGEAQ